MLETISFLTYLVGHLHTHSFASTQGFTIQSPAFEDGDRIPTRYTCHGRGDSIPLQWFGIPKGAKCLVLVMVDVDAPGPPFVHWFLYDLPGRSGRLKANAQHLPEGTKVGLNGWGQGKYGAPCPPAGEHRYYVRLYALNKCLSFPQQNSFQQIAHAMQGHIIGETQIMGRYSV